MTTDIEKKFFKVFGIEPKQQDACTVEDKYWQNEELANKYGTFDMYMNAKCGNQENCTTQCSCAYTKEIYPKITDTVLLQLACIIYQSQDYYVEIDELRQDILEKCLKYKDDINKQQVQQLFKGEE
jgi:predicted S18 family serine protease